MNLAHLAHTIANLNWFDYVGYLGMILGLVSMAMRTIIPLRLFAIGGCACLGTFALFREAWPTLVVNATTIPVLAYRTREMIRLTRRVKQASATGDLRLDWLLPFMHRRSLAAGTNLCCKGDPAPEMFYVVKGRLRLVEFDVTMGPGDVVGEIAMFSPARARTATVVAETDAELMAIGESELKQLYHQNPSFGFYLIQLITHRLIANIEQLQAKVAANHSAIKAPGSGAAAP